MSDDKKLLSDIKAGKGLPPIIPPSDNKTLPSGLTTENRGQIIDGFRLDRFGLNSSKDKNVNK